MATTNRSLKKENCFILLFLKLHESMARIGDGEDIDWRWRGLFSPQQASAARVHETIVVRGRKWGDRAKI